MIVHHLLFVWDLEDSTRVEVYILGILHENLYILNLPIRRLKFGKSLYSMGVQIKAQSFILEYLKTDF